MQRKPITPRNGHTVVAGIVARISGCANQKELSLEDQADHGRAIMRDYYDGPVEYRLIATKGKGEWLDRPEVADIEALVRTAELDVLISEDIGRVVRGAAAVRLCGIAVDNGTRVIAPNDCIDTADETWEEDVIQACRDHVGHNAHTSRRLKFKLMNRFEKFGGAMARPIFGYIVPEGAKTYDDWTIEDSAIPIYRDWFRRLREVPNCCAVADWLNSLSIPTGRYCRSRIWSGKMVRRITENPLLKGLPERGRKHTVKHNESGHRVSVPSPDKPKIRPCPHLEIISPDEFDTVNAIVDAANKHCGRKPVNGVDPLLRSSRKRSRFPGHFADCVYCGREYTWGANGITDQLQCKGSRAWTCWNSVGMSGRAAAEGIMTALQTELFGRPGFDDQFRAIIAAVDQRSRPHDNKQADRLKRLEQIDREKMNIVLVLKSAPASPTLLQTLMDLEAEEATLSRQCRVHAASRAAPAIKMPDSAADLRCAFEQSFGHLALTSFEFAERLRPIVVGFHVEVVRLFDGGHLLPRAHVDLDLSGILPDVRPLLPSPSPLLRRVVIDLFTPPDRERIRADVMRRTSEGAEQRAIAAELNVTQAAVSQSLIFARRMQDAGLSSPYLRVSEPPADYTRLRRHKHPRYRFTPLSGYPLFVTDR